MLNQCFNLFDIFKNFLLQKKIMRNEFMKAVLYEKKKLNYCETVKPIPSENELLVEIRATSVNAADYRMMQFGFAPKRKIFGADISGVVVSVGNNVKNFKVGDNVIGELSDCGFGGFAEYVNAPEKAFTLKPIELSFIESAALPLAAITALQALRDKCKVSKDAHILILGSSGGVGVYALQLAKYFGAIVTAVCSSRNIEQSKSLGADFVFDYSRVNINQLTEKFDIVLAVNGNYPLTLCKKLLKPNGRYVMAGGSMSQVIKSILFGWILSFGSKKMIFHAAKSNIDDLKFITNLAIEGKIIPVIDKIFPLIETPDAFQYILNKHTKSKVIISIKES